MNVLSEYSLLLLIGLVFLVFGENESGANVRVPNCCSAGEYFNSTSNQCQMKVAEPAQSGNGDGNFSVYSAAKIPVTKCCSLGYFYDIGKKNCCKINSSESMRWPPVHSLTDNRTVNVFEQDFQVTTHLIQCPNGSIAQTSTEFTLFADGTVKIPNIASKFKPEDVCIANSLNSKDFVARFCVPDPCTSSICVRKCCDTGYLMNQKSKSCEPTNLTFSVDFRNENGETVPVPNNLHILPGVRSSCHHLIQLDPEINKRDGFYILPNDTVYVPAYPEGFRVIDDYCVEDYKMDDKIVSCSTTVINRFYQLSIIIFLGEKVCDLRR
jgi:hypothetical protein